MARAKSRTWRGLTAAACRPARQFRRQTRFQTAGGFQRRQGGSVLPQPLYEPGNAGIVTMYTQRQLAGIDMAVQRSFGDIGAREFSICFSFIFIQKLTPV